MKKQTKMKIKTMDSIGLIGLFAVMMPIVTTACSNGTTEEPQIPKLYPYPITGTSIQVWQEVGVTGPQMETAFQNLVDGYDYLAYDSTLQNKIKNEVREIRITSPGIVTHELDSYGKYIIFVGHDAPMDNILEYYAITVIAQISQPDDTRLAKEFDNAKKTIRITKAKTINQKTA